MGKITDFFKTLFKRPIIEQRFTTKTPEEVIKQLELDYYTKQLLKENAQLKTEVIKRDQILKKFDEQKELKLEEEAVEKEIWNKRVMDKKLEREKSVIFKLVGTKAPKLFTKSNKSFGKFIGFYIKETDDGQTLWSPLIKWGAGIKKINCVSSNPLEYFTSIMNIPSQLRGGKIDTDIDFSKEGRAIIVKDKDIIEKLMESKYGKGVKVVHLDEMERAEYQQQMTQQREQIKQLYSQLRQISDMQVDYEAQANDLELENAMLQKDRDLHASRIVNMMDKQHAMAVETAKANTAVQDAVLHQLLTEKAFKSILEAYDEKVDIISKKLPKEEYDLAREQVKRDLLEGVAIRKGAERPNKIVLTPEGKAAPVAATPEEAPPKK